ncbi:hypothetical protein, partial [Pseudescherichia sp.]|uniref:hypothetical protein n=1 Tax=Pseudescherichia sp. TaxID=2055881 RepID=UPI002899E5A0
LRARTASPRLSCTLTTGVLVATVELFIADSLASKMARLNKREEVISQHKIIYSAQMCSFR